MTGQLTHSIGKEMRDKSIDIREQLIHNAIQLFLRKGYKGTTIREITDSANITKGAFYWHFKSKDELLGIIVDHYEMIFVDEIIKAVLRAEGNAVQKIKYAHKYATEFAYANRELCIGFMVIAAEMAGSGTEAETKIRNIYAKYRNLYEVVLNEGRAQGVIRDDIDTDLISHVINSIHNGTLLEWYLCNKEIDGHRFALAYREITLNGILKKDT
jgi:AcrR family transcriptional regulator